MECGSSRGKRVQIQGRHQASLLDLDDDLVAEIFHRLNTLSNIVRLGGVNKRLNRISFAITRLKLFMLEDPQVIPLHHFLHSLSRRGSCLRDVSVHHYTEDNTMVDLLDWIHPVANTLHSLALKITDPTGGHHATYFPEAVSRCTSLVSLEFNGVADVYLSSEALEQVVESCPKLQVLVADCVVVPGDLRLKSSSLQRLVVSDGRAADLDTPSLTDLQINCTSLIIRSHSLKRLRVAKNPSAARLQISPPLSNLELLFFESEYEAAEVKEVLSSIRGGCVDALTIHGDVFPKTSSMDLAEFLKPLTRVRALEIGPSVLEEVARFRNYEQQARVLTRLGVEEVVVKADAVDFCKDSVEQYDHLVDSMLLLRSLLGSSSLKRLVIDYTILESGFRDLECTRSAFIVGCRRALKRVLAKLKDEFPGLVLERHDPFPRY